MDRQQPASGPGCLQPEHARKKQRSAEEIRSLGNRLARIEGQVRGVRRMVEEGAWCPDILVQVSAIRAALDSFSRTLLSEHIRSCVQSDIREGREDAAEELVSLLQTMMK